MKKDVKTMSHSFLFGYNKKKHTENEILEGINTNNDDMIRYIYKSFYPGIKSMVYSFHTLYLDPEDIFQEGLTRAVINVRENKFKGGSTFNTYLSSICRNVCLKEMQKRGNTNELSKNETAVENAENQYDEMINRMVMLKDKMDDTCRQIIDLRFGLRGEDIKIIGDLSHLESIKFEEIARQLNIEADNARQRFKRCLEKLKSALSKDQLWIELAN